MSDSPYESSREPSYAENPYESPMEPSGDEPPPGGHEHAGRGARLGGALIDGIIGSALNFGWMMATGIIDEIMRTGEVPLKVSVQLITVGFIIFLILHGYLLANRGQTIGKALLGTRIVDLNGQIPSFGKVVGLRYFLVWVLCSVPFLGSLFGLADSLFIFRQDRRCIHDHMAGTQVVVARQPVERVDLASKRPIRPSSS